MKFPIHSDFLESVRIEGGGLAPATIQRVSDRLAPSLDFSSPRLIIRVRPTSPIVVGSLIKYQGARFLMAAHAATDDYRSFWAFEATRLASWQTIVKTTDALTGLEKSAAKSTGVPIWVGWEIMTRQPYERQIGVSNEVTRVMTAADVQLNDIIDGQQVKRVNHSLGLNIAEVS